MRYTTGIELVEKLAQGCDDPIEKLNILNLKDELDRVTGLEEEVEDEKENCKILRDDLDDLPDRYNLDEAVGYIQDAQTILDGINGKMKKDAIMELVGDLKYLLKQALSVRNMVPKDEE